MPQTVLVQWQAALHGHAQTRLLVAVGGLPDFCGGLLGDVMRSVLQGAWYLLQLCWASQLLHTVCPSGKSQDKLSWQQYGKIQGMSCRKVVPQSLPIGSGGHEASQDMFFNFLPPGGGSVA